MSFLFVALPYLCLKPISYKEIIFLIIRKEQQSKVSFRKNDCNWVTVALETLKFPGRFPRVIPFMHAKYEKIDSETCATPLQG